MISISKRLASVTRIFDPYSDRHDMVRLDRNEDPVGWDVKHFSEWISTLTPYDLAAYADSALFKTKLTTWLQVACENLYITAGSDAAIKNVFEAYIDPGDRVLLQEPGWRMYEVYGNIYQADLVPVHYSANLSLDIETIFEELRTRQVKMLVLANPNQPTGTLIDDKSLTDIINEAQSHDVLVIMDEAYHLFTSNTALEHIRTRDNVIIVRTFSKAFGLAGLRIGYCIAHSERIRELMLLRPVTDSNSLALKCAGYALDHMGWMSNRIADFIEGREYLYREMLMARIVTYPSHTNFLLIRCLSMEHGYGALEEIRCRGYLLKGPFGFSPLENCIRVSIGPLQLMQRFWLDCADILMKCSVV